MNIFGLVIKRNKPENHSTATNGVSLGTWQGSGSSFFHRLNADSYASVYPSIHAVSSEYKTVQPFAIDKNGKRVEHPAVTALYHPNQSDSSISFQEKIAVSTLSLRKTYILVWRRDGLEAKPGGDFTNAGTQIAGYTFLEFPGVTRRDGKTYYNIGAQEFSEREVIVLPGGVDPNNLYAGYSPSEAARRWATLDDYIADYQKGFFENGAIPSGQFIITSASKQDFNDTVDKLQDSHRGARNNNNVTYTPRPVDPQTGKPADAKIEWIPFSQSNKDIALDKLFDQTNKRIDLAYAVPQIVKGVDDAATYANAQVAERGFSKRAVYPLLLSNYTQFTHELNRITNGLGVAITFKYDFPNVSDEDKVEAERKQLESGIILSMTADGYSLNSIVDAFKFTPAYKLLKKDNSQPVIDNPKPDVDEGDEVNTSPDPDKIDGITPVNKAKAKKKVVNEKTDLQKLEDVAREFMQAQIDKAIEDLDKEENLSNAVTGAPTTAQETKFANDMLEIIVSIMVAEGAIQYSEGIKLLEAAGLSTANLDEFILGDSAKTGYEAYLKKVGQSYSSDTKDAIQSILAKGNQQGWNRSELDKALRGIMDTDEWRVKRLSVTELNRSQSLSSVEAMKQIKTESGTDIEKGLLHTGSDSPCEFCAVLLDRWVTVDQEFIPMGDVVNGAEGGIFINDFVANDGYDIHPNGHCVPEYRVVT